MGSASLRLPAVTSSLKIHSKSNSATSEIKITTIQNMGHMQKEVGNLHSGNKEVSKSPQPGRQGWHGKGSQKREKGVLWIVEVLPNRKVEGETELSRVAGCMLKNRVKRPKNTFRSNLMEV